MSIFCAIQKCLPRRLMSTCLGRLADSQVPWLKNILIKLFMKAYKIELTESVIKDYKNFQSFNDFFVRALEEGARPVDQNAPVVSPADGKISEIGSIEASRLLQAKHRDYRLDELLPVPEKDWQPYVNGYFATIYLAPFNYHRVHMPCDGRLTKTVYVPGDLFSVNGTTATHLPRLFARNERLVAFFESDQGPFVMVLVGALIVSGIESVFHGLYRSQDRVLQWNDDPKDHEGQPLSFKAGDEFGRFKLGSTVILLFPQSRGQNVFTAVKDDVVQCGGRL